jgi:stage V sporulation protein G
VVITEVRIKLMEDGNENERLQAFCSVTFDDAFVVRDLKIIEGTKGSFVAMPSRKLTDRCSQCGCKNHLRSRFCNQCGGKLDENRATRDADGRAKLHADIAHPINSACREVIQSAVLKAFQEEKERSKQPGYVCTYDDFDSEYEPSFSQLVSELHAPSRNHAPNYRTHTAHAPRSVHANNHEAPSPVASREDTRSEGFGAGIL